MSVVLQIRKSILLDVMQKNYQHLEQLRHLAPIAMREINDTYIGGWQCEETEFDSTIIIKLKEDCERLLERIWKTMQTMQKDVKKAKGSQSGGKTREALIKKYASKIWAFSVRLDEIEINSTTAATLPTTNNSQLPSTSKVDRRKHSKSSTPRKRKPQKLPRGCLSTMPSTTRSDNRKRWKTYLQTTLKDVESSGLKPQRVICEEEATGEEIEFDLRDDSIVEQLKIDHVLNATMAKHNQVTDRAYSKLATICNLPKLNQIKKQERLFDTEIRVECFDNRKGSRVKIHDLVRLILKWDSSAKAIVMDAGFIDLKLSGDGTMIANNYGSHINFLLTILNDEETVMSSKFSYPFAIYKGQENYDSIREAVAPINEEIRELLENGIDIDDAILRVRFSISADYKFLLLITGLDSASAKHSCIYCSAPKEDYGKTDVNHPKRTIADIQARGRLKKGNNKKQNCSRAPLFDSIALDEYYVDILHMFLRVSDRLLKLLVRELHREDAIELRTTSAKSDLSKCPRLQQLRSEIAQISSIANVNINFVLLQDRSKDGTPKIGNLRGNAKETIFEHLKINKFAGVKDVEIKQRLWNDFFNSYKKLRERGQWTNAEVTDFRNSARSWLEAFRSVYQATAVTPYIHLYAAHVADLLQQRRSIWQYCQEGQEQFNDISKKGYMGSTNHQKTAINQLMRLHLRGAMMGGIERGRNEAKSQQKRRAGSEPPELPQKKKRKGMDDLQTSSVSI